MGAELIPGLEFVGDERSRGSSEMGGKGRNAWERLAMADEWEWIRECKI